jgi:hypothetical protein
MVYSFEPIAYIYAITYQHYVYAHIRITIPRGAQNVFASLRADRNHAQLCIIHALFSCTILLMESNLRVCVPVRSCGL